MAIEKVEFNYSPLRGKIKEKFGSEQNFARALGISAVTLNKKLNNHVGFSESEMFKSCVLLGISHENVKPYFFNR